MNKSVAAFLMLIPAGAILLPAQAPKKPATINVQSAILSTKEGQKAAQDLQNKFSARRQTLEKRQSDLTALQSRMRSGSATMTQQAKEKLISDIDTQTKAWNQDTQDFNAEIQQEQGQIMNTVGQKMLEIIDKYATEHGIFMVADVSNPRSPVLWADPSDDITNDVIKLYDQAHPLPAATPPAAVPPATKKQ
ncbi:MAG TPA: OmpH family outer membrane protein [Bryobacteraceae bacterium]